MDGMAEVRLGDRGIAMLAELSSRLSYLLAGGRGDSTDLAVDFRFGCVETPKNAVAHRHMFEDVADVPTGSIDVSTCPGWCFQMKGDKNGKSAWKNE